MLSDYQAVINYDKKYCCNCYMSEAEAIVLARGMARDSLYDSDNHWYCSEECYYIKENSEKA